MFDQAIFWLATFDQTRAAILLLGLPKFARWLLRRQGGVVKVGGFEFYPNRSALHLTHGTLADRFHGASSVSAIFVVGVKFYRAQKNLA